LDAGPSVGGDGGDAVAGGAEEGGLADLAGVDDAHGLRADSGGEGVSDVAIAAVGGGRAGGAIFISADGIAEGIGRVYNVATGAGVAGGGEVAGGALGDEAEQLAAAGVGVEVVPAETLETDGR
jgi:hypothetical protein